MILLDTETLIWVDQDDARLGSASRQLISEALDRNELGVSTTTFWEIAWLIKKSRIEMRPRMTQWRDDLLNSGVQEIPVNGLIGIPGDNQRQGEFLSTASVAIGQVKPTLESPRDRLISTPPHLLVSLIVATAMRLNAILITTDELVLGWSGKLRRQDARR